MRRVLILLAVLLSGCAVPVAAGLDEGDANRVSVALDRAHIASTKELDPGAEGKFRVIVAKDDVPAALAAMRAEELPRPRSPGVLESVGKGSLVPSQAAEHAQLVTGMAGDLQKTLEAVDGILVARVHLNIQGPDPLKDSSPHRSSASVLVEHRGATPPLAADAIQRLVAGGVAGLTPADVAVVMVARPSPAPPGDAQLSHVGPFAVSKSSVKPLAMVLGGLFVLVGALAVAALFLYMRLGRARAEAQTRVSR